MGSQLNSSHKFKHIYTFEFPDPINSLGFRLVLLVILAAFTVFVLITCTYQAIIFTNTEEIGALGVIGVLLITGTWFGSDLYVLRRLKVLLKATERLAAGDLSVNSDLPQGQGEISQLAFTFNKIAALLQRYISERNSAEIALKEREKRYRSVINSIREVIFQTDENGLWTFLNPAWSEITGFTIAETISTYFLDYIHTEDRQRSLEEFQALISDRKKFTRYEFRCRTQNGSYRWLELQAQLTLTTNGELIGTSGILNDITERKAASENLQKTNQTLQALIQAAPVAINILDPQANVQLWNPAAETIFGWSEEEVVGNHIPIVPEDKQEELRHLIDAGKEGTPIIEWETKRLRKDGSLIDVSLSTAPMHDNQGKLIGLMNILTNITERKYWEREREKLLAETLNLTSSLTRETESLAALTAVTANAISTLNLQELLNVLLARIVAVTHADVGEILLKENDSLKTCATIGIDQELDPNFRIPIGKGFAGKIAATMQPLYLGNAQTESLVIDQNIKTQGICTMLGVPLYQKGNLIGVMHVDWLSVHPYSEREMHLLQITAERCTMAILNAQLYQETKQLQELLQLQIDHMPIGCILRDRDFRVTDWNPAAEKIFGFTKSEALGSYPDLIIPLGNSAARVGFWQEITETNKTKYSIKENITKDRRTIICEWYNIPLKQADGKLIGYLTMVQDITKRQQTEEQLKKYAYYDTLTGLPNRALFLENLEQVTERLEQEETDLFAVLFLDLERFQIIKYSLGHIIADQLLIATSRRLESCLHFPEQVARVGLNEFAILIPNISEVSDATHMANRIYHRLASPFSINGHEVFVTPTIGIALSSIDYDRPEDFLRAADIAMHQAKSQGKSRYSLFDPSMQASALSRLKLEGDLRRAIERQELRVYYQPIVCLKTGRISGFEALVRWQHPTRGFISPAEFIPLAEEAELIGVIDRWVLREACRQISIWQEAFPQELLTISVNLSGIQLSQLGLIERTDQILRETGVKRHSLKLEITETSLTGNTPVEMLMLEQLKALGIKISIDDFGTGYSSLARLHKMPINTLKIDRSFVINLAHDSESLEIVRTIITLAHTLNMDVVAEGIETAEQLAQLQGLKCEYGQGYFFSKPIDSEKAWALLSSYQLNRWV